MLSHHRCLRTRERDAERETEMEEKTDAGVCGRVCVEFISNSACVIKGGC